MISILITHYNRYEALTRCLDAFNALNLGKIEIIVADDSSDIETQLKLKQLKIDKLLLSKRNIGLASNLNRGIKACSGDFILYCQEDFIPTSQLSEYLKEAIFLINAGRIDMCRLKANYKFPHLLPLSSKFKKIPKFSWRNFYYNTFQYSDNPFITTKSFFKKYGFFLENVSGAYGENEYAIRIMKSKAKIAISNTYPFESDTKSKSVILGDSNRKKRTFLKKIKIYRFLRSIRLHFEFLMYNKNKRKLITLNNNRAI